MVAEGDRRLGIPGAIPQYFQDERQAQPDILWSKGIDAENPGADARAFEELNDPGAIRVGATEPLLEHGTRRHGDDCECRQAALPL